MYMKSLIGRTVGSIISMQHHVAQAAIANGTHVLATHEEIIGANLPPEDGPVAVEPEAFPEGYSAQPCPGGFELIGPDGAGVNDEVYPNLPAALSAASLIALAAVANTEPVKTSNPEPEEPAAEPPAAPAEEAPAAAEEPAAEAPAEEAAADAAAGEDPAPAPSGRKRR